MVVLHGSQAYRTVLTVPKGGVPDVPIAFGDMLNGVLVLGSNACTGAPSPAGTVYATHDGGRSWQASGLLAMWPTQLAAGQQGRLVAAVGWAGGSFSCHTVLAISYDGGVSFHIMTLAGNPDCNVDIGADTLWMLCSVVNPAAPMTMEIPRSTDGGAHWTATLLPQRLSISMLDATSATGAMLVAGAPGTLFWGSP